MASKSFKTFQINQNEVSSNESRRFASHFLFRIYQSSNEFIQFISLYPYFIYSSDIYFAELDTAGDRHIIERILIGGLKKGKSPGKILGNELNPTHDFGQIQRPY